MLDQKGLIGPRIAVRSLNIVLYALFLISGLSGLVYQVVWKREFSLIFGVTSYAVGTVLSAFFAGLALGSWLASRWIKRGVRNPLRLYGWLELAIAAYALVTPFLLDLLNQVYLSIFPLIDGSFTTISLLRFVGSMLVLLFPTTLMGATLPLVSEALSRRLSDATVNVGNLYTINTLGALGGAALSGYYTLGFVGVFETTLIGVTANVLAAGGALLIAGGFEQPIEHQPSRTQAKTTATNNLAQPQRQLRWLILVAMFVSGFAALGYEVIWTRVLSMFTGRTVAAFTTILCSVLFGIVLGSWFVRLRGARLQRPIAALVFIQMGVAWSSLLSIIGMSQFAPDRESPWVMLFLGLILIVPNALLGATLPLAVRIYQAAGAQLGQSVGEVYAANVLGGVLGSFSTSFLLVPWLGSQTTIVLLVVLNTLIALLLLPRRERQTNITKPTTHLSPTSLFWMGLTGLLTIGIALSPNLLLGGVSRQVYGNDERVLFQEEGVEGTVVVTELADGTRQIYVNGTIQSGNAIGTLLTHRRLAHLPLLLHSNPRDVLVVGIGSGTTAGTATRYPMVERIKVVELSPGMVRGSEFFTESNYNLLGDPRTTVIADDGRNFLMLTDERFDVIESDIILPYHAGANNLYAKEYYELIKSRLKPGGVVSQWIDVALPEAEYQRLLRTFVSVFPNTTLWEGGSYAIAQPDGIRIDPRIIRERFADPTILTALFEAGYTDPENFLQSFTMGPESIQRYLGEGPILTDNQPYLEYVALPPNRQQQWKEKEPIEPYLLRE
jgi:spermidine synthase